MIPIILKTPILKKTPKKIIKKFIKIANLILIVLTISIYFIVKWLKENFNNVSFNDILFNIFMSIRGTEKNLINQFILKCILPTIIFSVPILLIVNWLTKISKKTKNVLSYNLLKKNKFFNIIISDNNMVFNLKILGRKFSMKLKKTLIFILIILIEFSCIYIIINSGYKTLKIDEYINENKKSSNFIKTHYVDPKKVKLTFPKKKQNLIYIFAESLESSFFSKKLGGNEEKNLMEPLTQLTLNNLNFSNSNKIGGACSTFGSTFTTAGLVSQTLGIPLKISRSIINTKPNRCCFFDDAYGIGNILQKAGYKQMFLIGSDKQFGNRNVLMERHGNYEIYDYYSALEEQKIEPNYKVWWGLEDSKLFEIAKEKVLDLAQTKKPFNLTLLTTNTHCPEGFVEKDHKPIFDDKYSNAIFYSAMQINEFIEWIKQQPFFKNTTIIVAGDHLSMATKHFENKKNKFNRTIFNLFINSKAKPKKNKDRIFCSLDMFPTTIASLGIKIKGNKLGLGTNLFSSLKTLPEIYGIDYLNDEFKKHSQFYDENFICKK